MRPAQGTSRAHTARACPAHHVPSVSCANVTRSCAEPSSAMSTVAAVMLSGLMAAVSCIRNAAAPTRGGLADTDACAAAVHADANKTMSEQCVGPTGPQPGQRPKRRTGCAGANWAAGATTKNGTPQHQSTRTCRGASRLPPITTRAPAAAKAVAIALPMPDPPPVTRTRLPARVCAAVAMLLMARRGYPRPWGVESVRAARGDCNPPIHRWGSVRVLRTARVRRGGATTSSGGAVESVLAGRGTSVVRRTLGEALAVSTSKWSPTHPIGDLALDLHSRPPGSQLQVTSRRRPQKNPAGTTGRPVPPDKECS